MFAPTGSGVFTASSDLLEKMNPFQGGGDMIKSVTFEKTTYADLPNKFEAGTPAIARRSAWRAIDYLNIIGREKARLYDTSCCDYATERLSANRRRAHHRHGEGKVERAFVYDRERSSARHRHDSGSAGHCRSAPDIIARSQ
jgi:selenocysteine lyase/cysteine desulfurase